MTRSVILSLLVSFIFLNLFVSITSADTIQLPQTGQTKCYDPEGAEIPCAGTWQDGEVRSGAAWPEPRFMPGTGGEADCITDNLTGLMWPRNGNLPDGPRTWEGALDYVAYLNSIGSLCGYADWRLPNINELESLINADAPNTAAWLNAQGFTNVQSQYYWSSTTTASTTSKAKPVDMVQGYVYVVDSVNHDSIFKYYGLYVLPVRSGQSGTVQIPKTGQTTGYYTGDDGDLEKGFAWPDSRFTVDGDCVTDNLTGLMWTKNAHSRMTWQGALDYAKKLTLCGYNDWRLPNKNELHSLIDYSNYGPALPSNNPFINVETLYWLSTSVPGSPVHAWFGYMRHNVKSTCYVGPGYKQVDCNQKSYRYYDDWLIELDNDVWPVRGGQVRESFDYYCDGDADGYISSTLLSSCIGNGCVPAGCRTTPGDDCDDKNASINPTAAELCDNVDNNCSAQTDEGCDDDDDNFCDSAMTIVGTPDTCSSGGDDCDDDNAGINPGKTEGPHGNAQCSDALDNDCDGAADNSDMGCGVISLPQTGQTKCYDTDGVEILCSGTGQDGESRAGAALPNPRFTVDGDCVTDNLTGLMWTKNGNLPNGSKTWYQAIDYANNLTLCGYTDWRLPNLNELESLVNADVSNMAEWLNTQGFINVQSNDYWSSTTFASSTGNAWGISFNNAGWLNFGIKNRALYCVLPVRAGQNGNADPLYPANIWKTGQTASYYAGDDGDVQMGVMWPSPRFSTAICADGSSNCITDNLTGLIWTKDAKTPGPPACASGTYKTWQAALDYVKCLNNNRYLGYTDWRLPNRKELRNLIDYSKFGQALPSDHPFTNVQYGFYWSSTTVAGVTASAWGITMLGGYEAVDVRYKDRYYDSNYFNYVWPVRGKHGDSDGDGIPVTINLKKGFNLISYSGKNNPVVKAFDFIKMLGSLQELASVMKFDSTFGSYKEVKYNASGEPEGDDFELVNGEGYIVYSKVQKTVDLIFSNRCSVAGLKSGVNLIGTPCVSVNMTAYQLLQNIGNDAVVSSIQRFNADTGKFETVSYLNGQPTGVNFPIRAGEGYFIYMKQDVTGFKP